MMPMGMYHFPRLKGPGTNPSRPEVIRRKIGVTYEVYKPMTAALFSGINKFKLKQRECNSPSQRRKGGLAESKQPTNTRKNHHKPYSVDRSLSIMIHFLPPSRSGECIISCESKYNTRSIDPLRCTSDILQKFHSILESAIILPTGAKTNTDTPAPR